MNILLIHPNKFAHRYVSVGIAMISAVLKKAGHAVSFIDTSRFSDTVQKESINRSERSLQTMKEVLQFLPVDLPPVPRSIKSYEQVIGERIKEFKPDLIGFTATSSEFPTVIEIVSNIQLYQIPIIVGGTHATVAPLEVLAVPGIDMAMVGEGEDAILELIESLRLGLNCTDIQNIYFKNNGQIISNPPRPYIRNLDALPFLDIDMFDLYHHLGANQGKIVTYARVETGRGCPYQCTYCYNSMMHTDLYSNEKNHVRNKSPRRVIDELIFLKGKIDFNVVRFVDETFTACSLTWLTEFVELYKQHINTAMIVTTRPERVTREKMAVLRTAHKEIQVTMGIESGSERIRREVLDRRMSNQTIINAYGICHEYGFSTASFNMIGLPGETRKEFFETIELNRDADVQQPMLSYFYPFPGCALRKICIQSGFIDDCLHEVDYSVESVLRLPDFPLTEMQGLKRTFVLYVKMGAQHHARIKQAERDDELFSLLVDEYNASVIKQPKLK